ncbi:MAG: hypothetical protein NTU58_01075 [Candidatus Nealsonbacteria bacterium]|nr:hypothetical protein [Candidatus Nealsonbacteria bacterium]
MEELIAKIILGTSLTGIGAILIRKIPLLKEPAFQQIDILEGKNIFLKIKDKILTFKIFSSPELFLQKILSKVRVFTLRFEKKIEDQLKNLREKAKEKNNLGKDDYWDEVKKKKEGEDKKF